MGDGSGDGPADGDGNGDWLGAGDGDGDGSGVPSGPIHWWVARSKVKVMGVGGGTMGSRSIRVPLTERMRSPGTTCGAAYQGTPFSS